MTVENITKLEAANRQFVEAIHLFFEECEPIAVHTLAAASHQVLADLCKKEGNTGLIRDNPLLRPERKKDWNKIMSEAANFFKHADKDPASTLSFNPRTTEFFLFDCANLYEQLQGHREHAHDVFLSWVNLCHPKLIVKDRMKQEIEKCLAFGIKADDKALFIELLNAEKPLTYTKQ